MNLSPSVYQKAGASGSLYARSLEYIPFRDLEAHLEHLKNLALEFGDDAHAGGNRDVLEIWIAAHEGELERRNRLYELRASDPLIPSFEARTTDTRARISAVKAAWPIVTFCEQLLGLPLRRSARDRWVAQCPLTGHNDITPSFTVYQDTDSAWCFGCQRGGDILELAGHVFGHERFFDRLECLERLAGIDPKQRKPAPITAERFIKGRWVS